MASTGRPGRRSSARRRRSPGADSSAAAGWAARCSSTAAPRIAAAPTIWIGTSASDSNRGEHHADDRLEQHQDPRPRAADQPDPVRKPNDGMAAAAIPVKSKSGRTPGSWIGCASDATSRDERYDDRTDARHEQDRRHRLLRGHLRVPSRARMTKASGRPRPRGRARSPARRGGCRSPGRAATRRPRSSRDRQGQCRQAGPIQALPAQAHVGDGYEARVRIGRSARATMVMRSNAKNMHRLGTVPASAAATIAGVPARATPRAARAASRPCDPPADVRPGGAGSR